MRKNGNPLTKEEFGEELARWTSDLKVVGSRPGTCHRVVSLDKKQTPHFLSSRCIGYWRYTAGDNPAMDLESHLGESTVLSGVALAVWACLARVRLHQ